MDRAAAQRHARGAISPLDHVKFGTASAFSFSRDAAPRGVYVEPTSHGVRTEEPDYSSLGPQVTSDRGTNTTVGFKRAGISGPSKLTVTEEQDRAEPTCTTYTPQWRRASTIATEPSYSQLGRNFAGEDPWGDPRKSMTGPGAYDAVGPMGRQPDSLKPSYPIFSFAPPVDLLGEKQKANRGV